MVGLRGRAETEIISEGTVFVRGELWRARSPMKIARGEIIRVTGVEGLTLEVEAEKDDAVEPRKASALEG
jgi:membrane-bound serine protease (ClpP class)